MQVIATAIPEVKLITHLPMGQSCIAVIPPGAAGHWGRIGLPTIRLTLLWTTDRENP